MVIVTGAGGFIGSNIVAALSAHGNRVITVCDYWGSDDKWRNIAAHQISHFINPSDLISFLLDNAAEVEAVVHMGAISSTTERDVDKLVADNIQKSVDIWDFCTAARVPLIYASSAATYGASEKMEADDQDLDALSLLRPLNAYGWSKHATDRIFAQRVARGLPSPPQWCGLKFFNVYGPHEYHKGNMRSVVTKFFDDVVECKPIKLFQSHREGISHGFQSRDFVYVKDCVKVVQWLLANPAVSGLFNVGSGEPRSFRDVIFAMARIVNVEVTFDFVPMPKELRASYQYHTKADIRKLRSAGYTNEFASLEDGISDYLSNYLLPGSLYQ